MGYNNGDNASDNRAWDWCITMVTTPLPSDNREGLDILTIIGTTPLIKNLLGNMKLGNYIGQSQ